ncbi:hypothetical protein RYH80_04605 [Halobaculum sp. MBLA0147]|uniref:hypothetical protein n=1 Tax=Halobaculum sp. MBLA0147 TaxID=3079934 RepID=UPI003525959A
MTDDEAEILGTTKVARRWRISLIKAVREELGDEDGPEIGDRIVFRKEDGEIVVDLA